MLTFLQVRDFAIIDAVEVEFGAGLEELGRLAQSLLGTTQRRIRGSESFARELDARVQ